MLVATPIRNSTLQHPAAYYNTLQHMQHTATHLKQHTSTHCNRSYMRYVASVMQEPVLVATTIRDNIMYGMLQPPDHFESLYAFNAAGALQCVVVCYSVLRCLAVSCSVLQRDAA